MTAISRADLELDAMYAAFKAAVGEYTCPCGSTFEFGAFDTLADYAALNRWLGRHYDDCPDMAGSAPELRARVDELTALAKAQSEEIRSLNLQLDQARWKKAEW
ncbi:MAG: hypothetical protein K0U84_01845 [Actinomycetia bacterium]|nr:hypothetical protein [Actinomycetes bacterium]